MKVVVDWDLCQGHGACMGEAPEVFHVSDGGKLEILLESPPEELREKIESAVYYCPTGAITLDG